MLTSELQVAMRQALIDTYVGLKKRRLEHPLLADREPELEKLEWNLADVLRKLVEAGE
jgi:hypothetical protein